MTASRRAAFRTTTSIASYCRSGGWTYAMVSIPHPARRLRNTIRLGCLPWPVIGQSGTRTIARPSTRGRFSRSSPSSSPWSASRSSSRSSRSGDERGAAVLLGFDCLADAVGHSDEGPGSRGVVALPVPGNADEARRDARVDRERDRVVPRVDAQARDQRGADARCDHGLDRAVVVRAKDDLRFEAGAAEPFLDREEAAALPVPDEG